MTEEHLDLPMDYDSLIKAGAMVGSGGLVVMNEDTCIVEVARFFMNFTQNESCGKCVPCREGTKNMLKILHLLVLRLFPPAASPPRSRQRKFRKIREDDGE